MFPLLLLLLDLNSHSLDHNGRTTNDDNGLLLILLNKQAKWVLFVIRLLLPRFSFSLYWTLCHVCVSVTLFLSLLLILVLWLEQNGQWLISLPWNVIFKKILRNDPVTLNINDDEYVLDSYLSAHEFLSLYIESIGCP